MLIFRTEYKKDHNYIIEIITAYKFIETILKKNTLKSAT